MTQTTVVTLDAFLLARIAEDKARVTDGAEGAVTSSSGWHTVDCGVDIGYWATGRCTCRYVDRALAECEAKRRIVELHRGPHPCPGNELHWTGYRANEHFDEVYGCETLGRLALPYADHPDFREEWKV